MQDLQPSERLTFAKARNMLRDQQKQNRAFIREQKAFEAKERELENVFLDVDDDADADVDAGVSADADESSLAGRETG